LISPGQSSTNTTSTIAALLHEQLTPQERKKTLGSLCSQRITALSATGALAKKSIAETKASLAAELLFEKNKDASGTLVNDFAFLVELSQYRAFAQHRRPRFPSDSAGFSIPLSKDVMRATRFEGTLGADIFALVPPLKECGVQSIALCPRRYEKGDRLVRSPYSLTSVRILVDGKAEAILAPTNGSTGKVVASLRGSSNIELPPTWFRETVGTKTISAKYEFMHAREKSAGSPHFLPITSYPFTAAFEARVDLGLEASPLKTSRKLVTMEINPFQLTERSDLLVGNSELSIEGGECYLVTQWIDETI
jgi:hypothetical protein